MMRGRQPMNCCAIFPTPHRRICTAGWQANMTTCVSDQYWNSTAVNCEAGIAPWLNDCGSLKQRIQQRCKCFAVHPVRSGLARIAFDESALLGIAPQQLAWSREVFLYADNRPVVFAHSACARQDLRGAWSAVRSLGGKQLGALLFAHPLVERKPLHYKALRDTHILYRCAAAGDGSFLA